MSTTNSNNTALTTTINIVPVQGIFDQYHSIITFVGPAGDYFSAPISGVATLTSGTIAATPVNPLDITNKAYVDAVAQGLDIKASVVASTTANITLSGTQTVDGIALVANDRCLVKNQTAAADNGICCCRWRVGEIHRPEHLGASARCVHVHRNRHNACRYRLGVYQQRRRHNRCHRDQLDAV